MTPFIPSYRRNLPHLRLDGATYLVTWSLARGKVALSRSERDIVVTTLRHFAGEPYGLHAAVVMDDHVHVLVTPFADQPLHKILHSWKSFTAHILVKLGRTSPVWTPEYYDTIIRNEAHHRSAMHYIAENPSRRWPGVTGYRWLVNVTSA